MNLSEDAIDYASQEAQQKGSTNVGFEVKDVTDFNHYSIEERFDLITTFDALHDQAKPLNVLKGIYITLKDQVVYLMQDIHSPSEVYNNLDSSCWSFVVQSIHHTLHDSITCTGW